MKPLLSRQVIRILCQQRGKCRGPVHSMSSASAPHVAVVGSGPAGFYTAQQLLKGHPTVKVDIYEKLPVPFGLVRFGVAPDHPEVKNVINTFTQTANHERCTFLGNVNVGQDISIAQLRKHYSAVVLAYGADDDKTFGLPGENLPGVYSARSFVGWYNGLPENAQLGPDLGHDTAVVLGQGNVAVDVARILLTPVEELAKTDITDYALEALSKSQVERVWLVGRRGPLQVAFTTAELREMTRLSRCRPLLQQRDFEQLKESLKDVPRPRKRLTELMIKAALDPSQEDQRRWARAEKEWGLKFCRSPVEFLGKDRLEGVRLAVNRLEPSSSGGGLVAMPTGQTEDLPAGLVFRSIGYRSIPISEDVPFDHNRGIVPNSGGAVTGEKGLYVSGWVKTGPVGVIVSTMNNAFETGKLIIKHMQDGEVIASPEHTGKEVILEKLRENGVEAVDFIDWDKIDKTEQTLGELKGKPREKVVDVDHMMKIVRSNCVE